MVVCSKCCEEKGRDQFAPSFLDNAKKRPICRPCWRDVQRASRARHPEYKVKEAAAQRARYRRDPAKYKVRQVRGNARQRGLSIGLTDERIVELSSQDCSYCGAPAGALLNGIDRVDNRIGYEEGNVVPCCFVCNRAKQDAGREEFIAWAARVVARSKEE